MRIIEVRIRLYRARVYFVIGGSDEEISEYLSKHMKNADDMTKLCGQYGASTIMLESGDAIIVAKPNKKSEVFFSDIAHEIFHATIWIMKNVGITLSEESEEAFAYLNGYITQRFYKKSK